MSERNLALVTGASGGIGLELALSDVILASGRRTLRRRSTAASGAAPINTCDRENRDHD